VDARGRRRPGGPPPPAGRAPPRVRARAPAVLGLGHLPRRVPSRRGPAPRGPRGHGPDRRLPQPVRGAHRLTDPGAEARAARGLRRAGDRAGMTPAVLLFDIDGTLLHAGGAGRRAVARVFGERFARREVFDDVRFHGMTDRAIVRGGLVRAGLAADEAAIDA